jgi:kynurenine formamidase
MERDGFRVSRLSLGTHQGTHLDAPSHYLPDGAGAESVPLEKLCGEAVVLDIPRGRLGVIDEAALIASGELRAGARILIRTGWGAQWGGKNYAFEGPGLTIGAARLLADRGVWLLGMDTASPSEVDSEPVHRILTVAGVAIVENLANLDLCPPRVELHALPLPLVGCDGAPLRVVAEVTTPLPDASGAVKMPRC